MQQQAEEEELGLSCEALAALKEFALENNLLGGEGDDHGDVRLQVQQQLDVKAKEHDFTLSYGDEGDDEKVDIVLTGVNPELGQTLASTGLTVWRASQEMARFMWQHRGWFKGKSVLELGAGLGLCGVLASHLCVGGRVVITDGGDEFTESAMEALRRNLDRNMCGMESSARRRDPRCSEEDRGTSLADALPPSSAGAGAPVVLEASNRAQVELERLTWGEHAEFLDRYGPGGVAEEGTPGFDLIMAADVIYEEHAVTPLLRTVVDILRLRPPAKDQQLLSPAETRRLAADQDLCKGANDGLHESGQDCGSADAGGTVRSSPPAGTIFLLAFARRNVSIERVLTEARNLGLRWTVPDNFEPASASENVYLMFLAKPDGAFGSGNQ